MVAEVVEAAVVPLGVGSVESASPANCLGTVAPEADSAVEQMAVVELEAAAAEVAVMVFDLV